MKSFILFLFAFLSVAVYAQCTAPTNLSVTSVGSNSATISWTASGSSGFQLQYRKASSISWTTVTVSTSYHTLSSLLPSTQYLFRVKNICSGGVLSPNSSQGSFLTQSSCGTPLISSFVTTLNGSNSVGISWLNSGTSVNSCDLQYKKAGTTAWTTVSGITTPYILNGLDSCSIYQYRIKSNCASSTSPYSSIKNFPTHCAGSSAACGTPANYYTYFIGNCDPHGSGGITSVVDIHWSAVPNALYYIVRIDNMQFIAYTNSLVYYYGFPYQNTNVSIQAVSAFGTGLPLLFSYYDNNC